MVMRADMEIICVHRHIVNKYRYTSCSEAIARTVLTTQVVFREEAPPHLRDRRPNTQNLIHAGRLASVVVVLHQEYQRT